MRLQFAFALLLVTSSACKDSGQVKVQLDRSPSQTTFAELRTIRGMEQEQLTICDFPTVTPAADWRSLGTTGDSLLLRLPSTWHRRPPLDSDAGQPETVLVDSSDGRIGVSRETNGSVGASYFANDRAEEYPRRICEIGAGNAGAIWRLYEPTPIDSPPQYLGMGEVISGSGQRFKATVRAFTAAKRDSLARLVSDGAIAMKDTSATLR